MPIILDSKQLNSVEELVCIRKAVYIMKSKKCYGKYRFGAIGIRPNTVNTAIKRLGQCTHVHNGAIIDAWTYLAMAKWDADTGCDLINEYEQKLKEKMRVIVQQNSWELNGRRDEINTKNPADNELLQSFYEFIDCV